MDDIREMLSRGVAQLLDRADGPLHFRLVVMPTVVTLLAIHAGVRDACGGHPAFLWALLVHPSERARLVRSAAKDIGRICVVAIVLDTVYQLAVLRAFYPLQALIVAVTCAIVPYVLIRGPVTRLTRGLCRNRCRNRAGPGSGSGAEHPRQTEGRR